MTRIFLTTTWIIINSLIVYSLQAQTYEIYDELAPGIPSALPSKTIEVKRDKVEIYDHGPAGVKYPWPEKEIRKVAPRRDYTRDLFEDTPTSRRPSSVLDQLRQDLGE